jgi:hypothetical protein
MRRQGTNRKEDREGGEDRTCDYTTPDASRGNFC